MKFTIEELLLIENLTYFDDIPPLSKIIHHVGKTIKEYINEIEIPLIVDDKDYATYMPGIDFKNIIDAIKLNDNIMESKIIDANIDMAFGGGLGLSALIINEKNNEAVIAFRGTAKAEWIDDFLGANQVDSLQQINALEWYNKIYDKHHLNKYYITITGHSKGGNKAKYITLLNNTIDRCISFDGQGFSDKFIVHYKKEILERQNKIENHNVDFDYVNVLMNDIGKKIFYHGYNYGQGGFAESHAPNTFFNFTSPGIFKIEINPDGQRKEMDAIHQFFNSMIRSAKDDKERSKNNKLVGDLVEKAFSIGQEIDTASFISYLCDAIGNENYVDNTAYLLTFMIKYSIDNPLFLDSIKKVMDYFKAEAISNTIKMLEDLLRSKKLNLLLGLSNFLVLHVNKIVVKKIQSIAKKKYDVDLTKEQISKVLKIITIVKQNLNTLELTSGKELDITPIIEDDDLLDNLNIVILAGGLSLEKNISLYTGYMLKEQLSNKGHNVILLDPYMGYSDEELNIKNAFDNPDKYSLPLNKIVDEIPDLLADRKRRIYQTNSYFGPNVLQICNQSDLVFIALQGNDGENGKIQSTFDLLGIDYTGNDYSSLFKSSNKIISKELLIKKNIPVPNGYSIKKGEDIIYPNKYNISYPVVIKPNSVTFNVGISYVNNDEAFINAVNDALKYDNEVIIEEYIKGKEYCVSMVKDEIFPILEVLPLIPKNDDSVNLTVIKAKRCPCEINSSLANKIKDYAKECMKTLGLNNYCKIDFIIKDNGDIYCIDCNGLPSLSPYSQFSSSALEYGYSYISLIEKIINMSIKK